MVFMAKRLSLHKFLFLILLFAFTLGEVARIQFPNGVAIKALDIAVFLFVVLSILHSRKKLARPGLAKPILIFFSIAVFSLLFNLLNLKTNEFLISSLYLIRWIAYAGVYFIVANFSSDLKKKMPNLLVIAGGVILSLGFAQYLLYPNLRNLYYLGWDEHLYRLFSTFLDPNFAGAFFVLYFLFVLDLFFKKRRKILVFILTATLIGIVLTFSRSAYLSLIVGVFAYSLLRGEKRFIIGLLVVFSVTVLVLSLVGFRSEGTNLLRTASSEARLESAREALTVFRNNPILGIGFNAYKYASDRYGFIEESRFPSHASSGTDNSFLFVLATTGVFGFIAYIYLWFKIISLSFSKKEAVLFSSSIALLFSSLFINSLFYTFIMLWMWILLGLEEKFE